MTIDITAFITTNVFQDIILDKDTGAPLAGGIVTCYIDNGDRNPATATLKNWYFQTGTFGSYSYSTLPNPLTLSAIGTVDDGNGNQVLPFFYPFDESNPTPTAQKYYITVVSATGVPQFTLSNFPYSQSETPPPSLATPSLRNYLVNNNFWRNIQTYNSGGEVTIDLSNETDLVIAPSQHDGFSMPDIRFQKNQTGALDTLTFLKFSGDNEFSSHGDVTPEFYIRHACTSVGTETYKCYQIPLSYHLLTLAEQSLTFTMWAKENNGDIGNQFGVAYLQFYGSGITPSTPVAVKTFNGLTDAWTKWQVNFKTLPVVTANISATGDDALYIQIVLPAATIFDISFTLPSIYIGDLTTISTQNFTTYDQVDSIINSPRTGDYRTSLNYFGNCFLTASYMQSLGWVPANDGTIGSNLSIASTRANIDTWPLYNLIYVNVSDFWAPVIGGRTAPGNTTAAAYADFILNRPLTLTKNLGRVVQGLNPLMTTDTFTAVANSIPFTSVSATNSALNCTNTFTAGTAVMVTTSGTLPAPLVVNTVYYISSNPMPSVAAVYLSTTHANALAGENIVLTSDSAPTCSITTTNQFTLITPQLFIVGTPVIVSAATTLPNGLNANTVYYVSSTNLTSTTFNLSYSVDDAQAGINLPITTVGSGTLTISNALGATLGKGHNSAIPSHRHGLNDSNQHIVSANTPVGDSPVAESGGLNQYPINFPLNSTYHGITFVTNMQPTTNLNVYIKL